VGYTCLSLNVGSVVPSLEVPSDGTVRTVPAKPISGLADLRADLEDRVRTDGVMPSVGIVGGGATGTELAANLLGLAERLGVSPNVTLATSSPRLVPDLPVRASAALERSLVRRGLRLKKREAAIGFEGGMFRTEKDASPCEIALLATGLVANPVIERLDLSGSRHGLKVNRFLQSVDDDRVFAVGDCADFGPRRLPKLGVFGVRSAPILLDNLLARVLDRPLRAYRPQRIWLAILNLGDGRGFLRWGPLWWQGRSSQRFKDHLDRRFLEQFRG
jgi:NADH dehydrogenase FAD-containing subunit